MKPSLSLLAVALVAAVSISGSSARAGGQVNIRPLGAIRAATAAQLQPSSAGQAAVAAVRVEAGKEFDLPFELTYPNGEPVKNAHPIVIARSGRRVLEIHARPAKAEGVYQAQVKLPATGDWSLVIDARICGNTCTLSNVTALAAGTRQDRVAAQ
ncbi:MAG: hypothetical protein HOP12_05400 [Candidatus Eisenbacteria bacterium]|uniref:FixH family protein n=1 Tax=Eiseniibacteriota bacterium TaxID=2212470 RepID=A0A849SDY8_UNCEI|nr:hypothetical protein [Candidatus Eisenbacteria bacterium]